MIEAALGANECSQCLQIQLNALPARSSLTPFVKLLCSGRVRRDANSLRRPLSRVTPSRGELISIFPAGWAQWIKPSAPKQLFLPTRGNLRRDIGKTGARRLLSLLRHRLFCMPGWVGAWEAQRQIIFVFISARASGGFIHEIMACEGGWCCDVKGLHGGPWFDEVCFRQWTSADFSRVIWWNGFAFSLIKNKIKFWFYNMFVFWKDKNNQYYYYGKNCSLFAGILLFY